MGKWVKELDGDLTTSLTTERMIKLRSLIRVGLELGYLDRPLHDELRRDATTLSAYLFNQIKAIKETQVPAR